MKVYLGSDHAGFEAKKEIKDILEQLSCVYEDLGTDSKDNSVDYPDIAKLACNALLNSQNSIGILVCGSGTGMQIAANKIKGIRAAFCYDTYSAKMARADNNCNILTLRSREFDHNKYYEIIRAFLNTNFSGEDRHQRRIHKLE
jgi:ribose 5-phosphate isomerase B